MKKIKIIRDSNIHTFQKEIEKLLLKEWIIQGNMVIDNENYMYQMLVKK